MYKDSVEEQRYLSGMRREKESFEKLIREKSVSSREEFVSTSNLLHTYHLVLALETFCRSWPFQFKQMEDQLLIRTPVC